ncbi:MAG: helix-turn-helix domain-containing protein [Clostridiales bacterium]|nr:helix-turn-helix domain-containing protein [Clostridiales bacterium]
MNKFIERLKEALAENNLSQNALAQKINMSQSVVNNYFTGKREPSLDVLISICKELQVSADYLLGLTDYNNL